jgi:aminopeptidase N
LYAGRQRALRHLLKAYPGGNWRADDLRSALEQECGKNLAPLFRRWLVDPGIPEDFRGRYS